MQLIPAKFVTSLCLAFVKMKHDRDVFENIINGFHFAYFNYHVSYHTIRGSSSSTTAVSYKWTRSSLTTSSLRWIATSSMDHRHTSLDQLPLHDSSGFALVAGSSFHSVMFTLFHFSFLYFVLKL